MSYILVLPARAPPHSQYVSIKKHQQSTGLEIEVELTTAACVGMLAFAGRIYVLCFAGWNLIELVGGRNTFESIGSHNLIQI